MLRRRPVTAKGTTDASADLARFVDCGEIGSGGMGVVRRILDREIGRHAARKIIHDGSDSATRERFANEARILGRLEHPNIVPVYDVEKDEDGRAIAFTMKVVEGETLGDRLSRRSAGALDDSELGDALDVVLKICDAVAFAHSRGVLHRDLNPANVMIGTHGQVYVMDWGLALERGGPSQGSQVVGSLSGTLAYMAPEQTCADSTLVDERTDVFGIGAILYEVLTSVPPHSGTKAQEVLESARAGHICPPEQAAPDRALPDALCRIVLRALAKEPADRYPTVVDLRRDIEEFSRGGGWFPVRRFPAGATIVREGEPGDCAYIVREGRCAVVANRGGARVDIRLLGPGDVFGEIALFGGSPRVATVVASTEVALLQVTAEAIDRELARNSWVRPFLRALADRFAESERRVAGASRRDEELR